MAQQTLLSHIRQLIARDELPKALSQLRALLEHTPLLNDILQQSGRLAHIRRKMRLGTVSEEEALLEENRVRFNVLELLTDVEQEGLPPETLNELLTAVEQESARPELKNEWERAVSIVHSKNVIAHSNITGNVEIGDKTTQNAEKINNISHIENATFINDSSDKKIPRLLTNPPFNTDLFIGRENDLNAIETQYQAHNRLLVLVNGEGGIGKTTLAAKYWYAHADRYQHLAWLYADAGIGAALVTLKAVLGVNFEPKDDLETQVSRMAVAINNLEKPCLLVLDNANNAADLKKYYTTLHQLPNCHILLTSRLSQVAHMPVHKVLPLTPIEAVDLFKTYYPDLPDTDLPLLRDVLKAVGYNTLVTEVLAKNMAVFNRFAVRYALSDLLRDLQEKGLLALKNKAVAVVYGSDQLREAEPTDIIAAMYDLADLNDAERHVLSNLAVLPAENIAYTLLVALLRTDEEVLEQALGNLETKGWLEYRKTDNSFKISPVIQEVTRRKNAERLLDDCRPLVNTLTTGLDNDNRHTDNYQTATVFARLAEAVIYALPIDFDLVVLCQNIGDYHQDTGNLVLMLQSYQKMLDIQTALCAAEPDNAHFKNGLAISYSKLGVTHSSLGNLDKALEFFEKDIELSKELYAAYPQNVEFKNGLAVSYSKLGGTHRSLGNLDKALEFFEKDIELSKELYTAYPQNVDFKNGLAISHSKLGGTHSSLGNLNKALEFFEKDIELSNELYAAYPQNVAFKNGLAISYLKLGDTHRSLGNLDKALEFFEEYNRLEKELYTAYPQNVAFKNGLAISYCKLAEISNTPKNNNKAKTYFQEAEKLWLELVRDAPQYVQYQKFLGMVQEDIKALE